MDDQVKIMSAILKMFNHCGLALVHSGENLPDPKRPPAPSEYLVRLRRVARARRLSDEGLTALERICAVWEPAIARFAAGKTPLHFSELDASELATATATVESWLRENFPAGFRKK